MGKYLLGVIGVVCSLVVTGLASAEEQETEAEASLTPAMRAPREAVGERSHAPTEAAETPGHATGMLVQARVQAQSNLLSIGGSGFLVGYQFDSFALGLGLGFARLGVNSGGDNVSATLFQVAPTAIIDVWHSKDGRARANLIGSVGYAQASLKATVQTQECSDSSTGGSSCTTSTSDGTASANLIPVTLGFGGDYFLSRNFALGAEFGMQAMFLAGVNSSSGTRSASVDAGGDLEMAYGALRATFVIGD